MTIAQAYFLHKPNWANDLAMRYEWKTSIKTGIKYNERRSQLKSWPWRSMSYSPDFNTTAERNYFLNLMWQNYHKIFGIPIWQEASYLTSQADAGQAVLALDTTNRSFAQGQSVVLLSDYQTYESGIILLMDDDSITLSENLSGTWPAGTEIYPLLQARFAGNSAALKQATSILGNCNVSFRETYEADAMYMAGSHSFPSYNGFPVMNKEPNWKSEIEIDISRTFEVLEHLGVSASYCHPEVSRMSFMMEYMVHGRGDCYEFENFFNTMAGRWGQFWLPTWTKDVVPNSAIQSSDQVISIEPSSYYTTWLNNDLIGRVLFFKNYDGTEAYRYTTNASAGSITLDSAIGFDCSADQLKSLVCSFLLPGRWEEDELELSFSNDSYAEIRARFMTQDDSDMNPIS